MRLAFFRYLRPEARLYQLERRRGYLQERLADLRASVRTARERMDAYTIELMDHGLDEREREIAWLDRLIARERRSTERSAEAAAEQDPAGPPPAQLPQSPRDPRLPAQTG
jgi:hypothetical protein